MSHKKRMVSNPREIVQCTCERTSYLELVYAGVWAVIMRDNLERCTVDSVPSISSVSATGDDRGSDLHQDSGLGIAGSYRTFTKAFEECIAAVCKSSTHECITPNNGRETDKTSNML